MDLLSVVFEKYKLVNCGCNKIDKLKKGKKRKKKVKKGEKKG